MPMHPCVSFTEACTAGGSIRRREDGAPQMTAEHHWTASDGTRLFYRVDDFTDPWADASTVVLLHQGMGSSLRLFGWVPHLARHFRGFDS